MDSKNSVKSAHTSMAVSRLVDLDQQAVSDLLGRYKLELVVTQVDVAIPGSFWGDEEAGLIGNKLYARTDTPVHSILHEACHFICMPLERRSSLDTNAGGDYDEENAVCYLQILLANEISEMGSSRMMRDMDAWGYSFRLGSAQSWFEQDAEDAREWLLKYRLIGKDNQPLFGLRNI